MKVLSALQVLNPFNSQSSTQSGIRHAQDYEAPVRPSTFSLLADKLKDLLRIRRGYEPLPDIRDNIDSPGDTWDEWRERDGPGWGDTHSNQSGGDDNWNRESSNDEWNRPIHSEGVWLEPNTHLQ